jgi:hypothetical protein
VVRTSRNAIFGGFADMPWENKTAGGAMYFGGPNACLFKVETNKKKKKKTTERAGDSHKGNGTEKNDDTIKCYRWSLVYTACDISHKCWPLVVAGGRAFGKCRKGL